MPLVSLDNVSLRLPGSGLVLSDINLEIERGRHYVLTGPNGSGKSSLLRLMHGDLWPASGQIVWEYGGKPEKSRIIGRKISRLVAPAIQAEIQHYGWQITAAEMLAGADADSPYACAGTPDSAAMQGIRSLLAGWQASDLPERPLRELSQGQLRLLLLARAILARPALLLLDEWSDGLDCARRDLVLQTLEKLAANTVMVFASHRRDDLPAWTDAHIQLEAGRLVSMSASGKISWKAGRKTGKPGPACEKAQGALVCRLENASLVCQGRWLLKNISWQLHKGEHWQISGPNGAGKSVFLRLLAGDEPVYAGGALELWSAKTGRKLETLAQKRAEVSLVSDLGQACYGYDLTGLELVMSGYENSIGLYRSYRACESAWAKKLICAFFGPEQAQAIMAQSIRRLSTGQLRKLFLARALVARPGILLLDEPCSGLDAQSRSEYIALLDRIGQGGFKGIEASLVFVSHQDEDLPACINRSAVMEAGRLLLR